MSFEEWLKETFTDEIRPMAPALRIAWNASQQATAQRCAEIVGEWRSEFPCAEAESADAAMAAEIQRVIRKEFGI